MIAPLVEANVFVQRAQLAINAGANKSIFCQFRDFLLKLAFPAAHDRRQDHHALTFGQCQHAVYDLLDTLSCNRCATAIAMGLTDRGKQQAQVIVDLRDRADGRTGAARYRLLLDGNRRRKTINRINIGFFQLIEKLTSVRRKRFDIAPLAFGVDGIKREGRLARAREPGNYR